MSYEKQTWNTGDIITAEKLNHIENGISESSSGGSDLPEIESTDKGKVLTVVEKESGQTSEIVIVPSQSFVTGSVSIYDPLHLCFGDLDPQGDFTKITEANADSLKLWVDGAAYSVEAATLAFYGDCYVVKEDDKVVKVITPTKYAQEDPSLPSVKFCAYEPIMEYAPSWESASGGGLVFNMIYDEAQDQMVLDATYSQISTALTNGISPVISCNMEDSFYIFSVAFMGVMENTYMVGVTNYNAGIISFQATSADGQLVVQGD